MKKRIFAIIVTLIVFSMVTGCAYVRPSENESPRWEEPNSLDYEIPPEEIPPEEMSPLHEPEQFPSESLNTGEVYYVEGEVSSINDNILVIQLSEGGEFKLRLSKNSAWDSNVNDWSIELYNYIAVDYIMENGNQGEVIYIYINDTPPINAN